MTTWSPSNVRGPALSVPEPKRAKLRIIKAVYGPAENAADVTTKVKSLVAGGAKGIRAGNELAEDDPAPGVVKRLRVEFVLNGDTKSAGTREGQTLELPAGAEVTKALYGELRTRDNLALPERGPDAEAGRSESRATNWRSRLITSFARAATRRTWCPRNCASSIHSMARARARPSAGEMMCWCCPMRTDRSGCRLLSAFGSGADGQMQLLAWAPGEFTFRWASGGNTDAACKSLPAPVQVAGPWTVSFPPGWAAPASVNLEHLQSWTDNANPGVESYLSRHGDLREGTGGSGRLVEAGLRGLPRPGRSEELCGGGSEWKAARHSVEAALPVWT